MPDTAHTQTLALVRDLIFASRISAAARSSGISVKILRDPAHLQSETGKVLLVDLNQDHAIDAATEWKLRTRGTSIGFVAHVDADTIARARESGIDRILARSAFVAQLSQLLLDPNAANDAP